MTKTIGYFFVLLLLFTSNSYSAIWSSTIIDYMYGTTFVDSSTKKKDVKYDTITLEHASGWEYGDNFFFVDLTNLGSSSASAYAEFSPRFSTNKIFNIQYGEVLTDILLAAQINVASGQRRADLVGVGFDFQIPHFKFFNAALYFRDSKGLDKSTYQISFAWEANFNLGINMKFAGFLDYAGKEGTSEANLITQPQLLWVVNKYMDLGVELHIWTNKYGIKDLNETVPQLMVKWKL